jgi:hypothetical protein
MQHLSTPSAAETSFCVCVPAWIHMLVLSLNSSTIYKSTAYSKIY